MTTVRRFITLLAVLALVLLGACSDGDTASTPTAEGTASTPEATASSVASATETAAPAELTGRIVVSAASSLTDVFTELAEAFRAQHSGVQVDLNFASSSALAVQIVEGAPADVFASANAAQMQVVVDDGKAEASDIFAQNEIVVVTPRGRGLIAGFEDLASDGIRLVLAGPEVPVGVYAREAIAAADASIGGGFADAVLANVVSEEANVRAVLAKVELGEADAGIVYATDAAVAGDAVEMYRFPSEFAPPAEYVIAALTNTPEAAAAFVEFVLSEAGQAILERHGFSRAG